MKFIGQIIELIIKTINNIQKPQVSSTENTSKPKADYTLYLDQKHSNHLIKILGLLLIIWLFSGIRIINMEQKGVVTRFGQIIHTLDPGLHLCMPYGIDKITILDCTSIRRIDTDSDTMLTGDENIASIHFYVLWNIKDPIAFLFNAKSPESTVKAASDSIVREIIAQNNFDKILTTSRNEIAKKAHIELQDFADKCQLGIEIVEVQLGKVDPPDTKIIIEDSNGNQKEECVIEAYREVQRAKADFERSRNEAESYENYIIPESRGKAEKITQTAYSYKIKTLAQAQGQSAQFYLLHQVYEKNPEVIKARLHKEYKQKMLENAKEIIVGDLKNISPLLPMQQSLQINSTIGNETSSYSSTQNSTKTQANLKIMQNNTNTQG